MKCLFIFLNFRIHQAGQIEHPSGPDLAHGPYVWQPCFKKTLDLGLEIFQKRAHRVNEVNTICM